MRCMGGISRLLTFLLTVCRVQGLVAGDFAGLYNQPPPTWARTGVVRAFFQRSLNTTASELYVINHFMQAKIFKLSDFTGLVQDDCPRVNPLV